MRTGQKLITCLTAAAFFAGCGSRPARLEAPLQAAAEQSVAVKADPYRLPSAALVAVRPGSFDPKVEFVDFRGARLATEDDHGGVSVSPKILIANPVTGAAAGVLVGAVGTIGTCLAAGPLAPVCAFVIGPPLAAAGGIVGAGAGAVAMSKHIKTHDRASPTDARLKKQKVLVEELVLTARTRDPMPPIVEKVQGIASERHIAALEGSSVPEYVFELSVSGIDLVQTAYGDTYRFRFHGAGRLIRLADNTTLDTFVTQIESDNQVIEAGATDAALSTALESAPQKIAEAFVDQWIAPAMNSGRPAVAISSK